jgi:hypothetical protein
MSNPGNNKNNGRNNYANSIEVKKAQKAQKTLADCPKVVEAWIPRPSSSQNLKEWERPDGKNPDEWRKPERIGQCPYGWTKINPSTLKPK